MGLRPEQSRPSGSGEESRGMGVSGGIEPVSLVESLWAGSGCAFVMRAPGRAGYKTARREPRTPGGWLGTRPLGGSLALPRMARYKTARLPGMVRYKTARREPRTPRSLALP